MTTTAKYLRLMVWARNRYTRGGRLEMETGGTAAPFLAIERLAWHRYMAARDPLTA